ncbi:50S ribosome-binding GTPase [Bacillus sp. ISL-41]|uniref:GTPase n=1 Tax=Bacillus sp. ISL-41 TaxID=2819127 RepID=UPI001BECD847|nr:GTPase [Bacillus sp. ISL-41]MBT2642864.1 50S ribosome-binding GTPase [Bacillus sp. ISL-41]
MYNGKRVQTFTGYYKICRYDELSGGFFLLNTDVLYFLSHLIVTGEQVEERQLSIFKVFLNQLDLTEIGKTEIEKILTNDDNKLTLNEIIQNLKGAKDLQELALQVGVTISLVTDLYGEDEEVFFEMARKLWGISKAKYKEFERAAEELISESADQCGIIKAHVSLSHPWFAILMEVINNQDQMQMALDKQILFSESEYKKAIEYCKGIAKEDYDYASPILNEHRMVLEEISSYIKKILEKIDDQKNDILSVKDSIRDMEQQINQLVEGQLEEVAKTMQKKRKAMDHFTISFMGKTKAGKSTLHSIITGRGKMEIGEGKQRTTRYNRIYTWNNIRIIDTPGIGAPGGRSDEEIAESIIDESDLICYLVKNDSVQSAEFNFLKAIKEKNKPIIILLNVKENLDQPAKLKRFLHNPEHIYERKDSKSLEGHINRIRRYAEAHYPNNEFAIIPVQLYAAILSKDESFNELERKILYEGSHIEYFFNAIRLSIIKEGHIRRSQTILDGLIYPVHSSYKVLNEHLKAFNTLSSKLKTLQESNSKKLQEIRETYQNRIGQTIEKEFGKLEDKISSFATNHYHMKKSELEKEWSKLVKSIGIERSLKSNIEEVFSRYIADIEQYLKEMVEDLSFTSERSVKGIDVKMPNLFDTKRFFAYLAGAGSILMAIAPFLTLSGPIGWAGFAIFAIGTGLSFLFKSKKTKIKEAIDNLTKGLEESVKKQKREVKQDTLLQFSKSHNQLSHNIEEYQNSLISALDKTIAILSGSQGLIQQQEMKLNKAFGYRLLNAHLPRNKIHFKLNDDLINEEVMGVDRDFGKNMTIRTSSILDEEIQQALSQTIQEQIVIVPNYIKKG